MEAFQILRKKGWVLNPSDEKVNGILRLMHKNGGHCPCSHPEREGHDQCPCTEWIKNSKCYCGLYIKMEEDEKM